MKAAAVALLALILGALGAIWIELRETRHMNAVGLHPRLYEHHELSGECDFASICLDKEKAAIKKEAEDVMRRDAFIRERTHKQRYKFHELSASCDLGSRCEKMEKDGRLKAFDEEGKSK